MTKAQLIALLAKRHPHLMRADVDMAARNILDQLANALARGERIEIRGFGSFALHFHQPRLCRNPKTGAPVALRGKYSPHFKPGMELRERVKSGQVAHGSFAYPSCWGLSDTHA